MGHIETFSVCIPYTQQQRIVRVYLPQGYAVGTKRYPVVYMQDGQNLFTDETAFAGISWGLLDTLCQMEREDARHARIVVGLDNAGTARADEYSPWRNEGVDILFPAGSCGGMGAQYADFFAGPFKALIDARFRTLPESEHTAVCGSSLGGLISAYIAARYPGVYSCVGVFSLASWFAEAPFLCAVSAADIGKAQRFFIQTGTNESSDSGVANMPQIYIDGAIRYAWALLEKGVPVENIYFGIGAGGEHSERDWARHMRAFFGFVAGEGEGKRIRNAMGPKGHGCFLCGT